MQEKVSFSELESKNSVWMRDLKILWGEVVGDDVVTRSRHPSPKIPTAHWQELQSCTVSPPPLAIIEWGRWFGGKGAFAAFAHFTASPPIGYFTIWRYRKVSEHSVSIWWFDFIDTLRLFQDAKRPTNCLWIYQYWTNRHKIWKKCFARRDSFPKCAQRCIGN